MRLMRAYSVVVAQPFADPSAHIRTCLKGVQIVQIADGQTLRQATVAAGLDPENEERLIVGMMDTSRRLQLNSSGFWLCHVTPGDWPRLLQSAGAFLYVSKSENQNELKDAAKAFERFQSI